MRSQAQSPTLPGAPTLLLAVPVASAGVWARPLADMEPEMHIVVPGRDDYSPPLIDFVLSFRPPRGLLKTLPNLKLAFSLGAGVDGFLSDPEYPRQVPLVRFVDGGLSRDMTQYVVMHTLLHHRRQRSYDELQKQRKWRPCLLRMEDTRAGIMGLGEIGTAAGTALRDFGFSVAGWSRTRRDIPGIECFAGRMELAAFLTRADILVCVLPLTPVTRGILNRKTFAKLPRGSFVINIARGEHLVETDLIAALDSGHLAGAALDVFATEPLPESSPLWRHPKVTVTPHVAALSDPRAVARNVIEGISRHARGDPPQNQVDVERGY